MMEPQHLRKSVVRKYAKILQVDTTDLRPVSGSVSVRGSPLSANQTGILEKLALVRKSSETMLSTPTRTNSQHSMFKISSPKFENGAPFPIRLDSSMNNSQRLMTANSNSDNPFIVNLEERTSVRKFEDAFTKLSNPITARDAHITRSLSKSTHRDALDSICLTSPTNQKSRRTNSIYTEKESTIEDIYKGAKGFGPELNIILNQEFEKNLKNLILQHNVKGFADIQKTRVNNVVKIIEKGFLSKEAKESKVKQEIWQLLSSELNKVRSTYDEFLAYFGDTLEKVAKGKQKIYDHMKPWEALKLLIEQSFSARQKMSGLEQGFEDDVMQKIYQFKFDYRVSKDFNPKILHIYELMETHMKELNQLIEVERERYQIMTQQQDKMYREQSEQEKKQEVIKDEVLTIIKDWKKNETHKGEPKSLFMQEKHLQRHIDQLHDENIKLFDDNTQLKAQVKELKHEIKRILAKEEKAAKVFEDKEIMVDMYSQSIQTPKISGLSMYIKDLELSANASVLPDGMVVSLMNMILTDKMITDACDDYERRPRKPLNTYMTEWFLKRFGLHDFCEIILPDFMFSIQTEEGIERGKVFKALLGATSGQMGSSFRFSMDRHTQLDKNKLRKATFGTTKLLKYFYRIINCIKTTYGSSATKFFATHNYGPYLADTKQNHELMTLETAVAVLGTIATEENFTSEEVKDAEEYLQLRIQQTVESSTTSQEEIAEQEQEGEDEKPDVPPPNIDFDMFVRFMLEAVLEKQVRNFEKYYASIKTHVLSKKHNNISYDEYVASVNKVLPEATQAWKDHSYALLMSDQAANQVPLFKLVENLVDCYYEEDKAKELDQRSQDKLAIDGECSSARSYKSKIKKIAVPKLTPQASHFQPQALKNTNNLNNTNLNNNNLSRQHRLAGVCKEGLNLGNPGLNDIGYELYDCVSSLTLLQETYLLVEDSIKNAEKKDESLTPFHDAFVKDLEVLPKQLTTQESIDSLLLFPKEELVDMLEYLWGKLRGLLVHTFRSK